MSPKDSHFCLESEFLSDKLKVAAMVTPTQTSDGARLAWFSMAANLEWVRWVQLGQFPYLNQTVPSTD